MKTGTQGTRHRGPLQTYYRSPSNSAVLADDIFRWNPQGRVDEFFDFVGRPPQEYVEAPLMWNDTSIGVNEILTTDTKAARAYVIAPRSGFLVSASFVGEDALAANDTNYVTFTVVNRAAGAGSTAMLAATDPNTTKATGGAAIAAKTTRALTVHGTFANLCVAKGDVIEIAATVTGTLANAVDCPRVTLEFSCLHPGLAARMSRVAGVPTIFPSLSTSEATCATSATNEAQTVGFDYGDYAMQPANLGPMFECRFRFNGAVPAANERLVIGLASAFNATFDSVTVNAWFRFEANGVVTIEGDDGATDTDDQAASPATTLVFGATTYYVLTIDARDLSAVAFYVDGLKVGTVNISGAGSTKLQPVLWWQKDSGTGNHGIVVDYVRVALDRV